jgi:hypothetical protein
MPVSSLIAGIPYPSNTHASCDLLSCKIKIKIGRESHAAILADSSLERCPIEVFLRGGHFFNTAS